MISYMRLSILMLFDFDGWDTIDDNILCTRSKSILLLNNC